MSLPGDYTVALFNASSNFFFASNKKENCSLIVEIFTGYVSNIRHDIPLTAPCRKTLFDSCCADINFDDQAAEFLSQILMNGYRILQNFLNFHKLTKTNIRE